MGKLIMVRHGESEGNRDRRFTTTPDAPLTDLGREQAAQVARQIARRFHPRLIITSPYARARETGGIMAAALPLPEGTALRRCARRSDVRKREGVAMAARGRRELRGRARAGGANSGAAGSA